MSKTVAKARKKVKQTFQENLKRFEDFLNVVRGKIDIKSRLKLLQDPDNIRTSTRLTAGQIDAASTSFFVAKHFSQFTPLKEFFEEFCHFAISKNGLGREESIRYMSALSESKLLKSLGIFKTEQAKEKD